MQPQRSLARIAEGGGPTGCAQAGGCHCHICSLVKTINTNVLIRVPGFPVLLSVSGSSFCLLLTSPRLGMKGSGAQNQPVSSRYGGWLLHAGNCSETDIMLCYLTLLLTQPHGCCFDRPSGLSGRLCGRHTWIGVFA